MSINLKALRWAAALIVVALLSRLFPENEGSFDAVFFGMLGIAVVSLYRTRSCCARTEA